MKIFENRPLALACCLFAITSLFAIKLQVETKRFLLLLLLLGFLILLLLRLLFTVGGRYWGLSVLCLLAAILSLLSSMLFFDLYYARLQDMPQEICDVRGRVLERVDGDAASTLRVQIMRINGEDCRVDAIIDFETETTLQAGEGFRLKATPCAFSNEDGFDEEQTYLPQGVMLRFLHTPDTKIRSLGEDASLRTWASNLNLRLAYRLKNVVGGESGSLSAALLLGNREWLSGDTSLDFRRAGVSHLLALSGLHLSILIGFLELLLRLLRCPKGMRAVLILLSGLFFLLLTGLAVSTCRAYFLVLFLYLGYFLRESYDSFTALSVALVCILLAQPYAVLDLSLWMSFLAAGSIIVFLPAVSEWIRSMKKFVRRLLGGLLASLAMGCFATLSLMLLSARVFGEISLLSIPVTMILSVPVTLFLITSLLLLLFPPLAALSWIPALLGRGILSVVGWSAGLSNVLIPTGDPLTQSLLSAMSATLVLFAIVELRSRRWLLLPVFLAVLAVGASLGVTHLPRRDVWSLQLLEHEMGEVRLYTKRGEAVLFYDTYGDAVSTYAIRTAALDARCTELDELVICRYDEQLPTFLFSLSARIRIRDLHLPTPQNDREAAMAARLEQDATLHRICVHYDAEAWVAAFVGD